MLDIKDIDEKTLKKEIEFLLKVMSCIVDVNYIDYYKGSDDMKPSERLGLLRYADDIVETDLFKETVRSRKKYKQLLKKLFELNMEYVSVYNNAYTNSGLRMILEAQQHFMDFGKYNENNEDRRDNTDMD